MKINVTLELELTRTNIEDIFTTAIEGGSNYWYMFDDMASTLVRQVVPKSVDPYFATAIVSAILDHGIKVPVSDVETDEIVGELSAETMKDRFQLLFNDKAYRPALENMLSENGDANDADVVFQYLCFGEVIYG